MATSSSNSEARNVAPCAYELIAVSELTDVDLERFLKIAEVFGIHFEVKPIDQPPRPAVRGCDCHACNLVPAEVIIPAEEHAIMPITWRGDEKAEILKACVQHFKPNSQGGEAVVALQACHRCARSTSNNPLWRAFVSVAWRSDNNDTNLSAFTGVGTGSDKTSAIAAAFKHFTQYHLDVRAGKGFAPKRQPVLRNHSLVYVPRHWASICPRLAEHCLDIQTKHRESFHSVIRQTQATCAFTAICCAVFPMGPEQAWMDVYSLAKPSRGPRAEPIQDWTGHTPYEVCAFLQRYNFRVSVAILTLHWNAGVMPDNPNPPAGLQIQPSMVFLRYCGDAPVVVFLPPLGDEPGHFVAMSVTSCLSQIETTGDEWLDPIDHPVERFQPTCAQFPRLNPFAREDEERHMMHLWEHHVATWAVLHQTAQGVGLVQLPSARALELAVIRHNPLPPFPHPGLMMQGIHIRPIVPNPEIEGLVEVQRQFLVGEEAVAFRVILQMWEELKQVGGHAREGPLPSWVFTLDVGNRWLWYSGMHPPPHIVPGSTHWCSAGSPAGCDTTLLATLEGAGCTHCACTTTLAGQCRHYWYATFTIILATLWAFLLRPTFVLARWVTEVNDTIAGLPTAWHTTLFVRHLQLALRAGRWCVNAGFNMNHLRQLRLRADIAIRQWDLGVLLPVHRVNGLSPAGRLFIFLLLLGFYGAVVCQVVATLVALTASGLSLALLWALLALTHLMLLPYLLLWEIVVDGVRGVWVSAKRPHLVYTHYTLKPHSADYLVPVSRPGWKGFATTIGTSQGELTNATEITWERLRASQYAYGLEVHATLGDHLPTVDHPSVCPGGLRVLSCIGMTPIGTRDHDKRVVALQDPLWAGQELAVCEWMAYRRNRITGEPRWADIHAALLIMLCLILLLVLNIPAYGPGRALGLHWLPHYAIDWLPSNPIVTLLRQMQLTVISLWDGRFELRMLWEWLNSDGSALAVVAKRMLPAYLAVHILGHFRNWLAREERVVGCVVRRSHLFIFCVLALAALLEALVHDLMCVEVITTTLSGEVLVHTATPTLVPPAGRGTATVSNTMSNTETATSTSTATATATPTPTATPTATDTQTPSGGPTQTATPGRGTPPEPGRSSWPSDLVLRLRWVCCWLVGHAQHLHQIAHVITAVMLFKITLGSTPDWCRTPRRFMMHQFVAYHTPISFRDLIKRFILSWSRQPSTLYTTLRQEIIRTFHLDSKGYGASFEISTTSTVDALALLLVPEEETPMGFGKKEKRSWEKLLKCRTALRDGKLVRVYGERTCARPGCGKARVRGKWPHGLCPDCSADVATLPTHGAAYSYIAGHTEVVAGIVHTGFVAIPERDYALPPVKFECLEDQLELRTKTGVPLPENPSSVLFFQDPGMAGEHLPGCWMRNWRAGAEGVRSAVRYLEERGKSTCDCAHRMHSKDVDLTQRVAGVGAGYLVSGVPPFVVMKTPLSALRAIAARVARLRETRPDRAHWLHAGTLLRARPFLPNWGHVTIETMRVGDWIKTFLPSRRRVLSECNDLWESLGRMVSKRAWRFRIFAKREWASAAEPAPRAGIMQPIVESKPRAIQPPFYQIPLADVAHLIAGPILRPICHAVKETWHWDMPIFYASAAPADLNRWLNKWQYASCFLASDYTMFDCTHSNPTWDFVEAIYKIAADPSGENAQLFHELLRHWRAPIGKSVSKWKGWIHIVRYFGISMNASGRDDTALANVLLNAFAMFISLTALHHGIPILEVQARHLEAFAAIAGLAVVGDDSLVALPDRTLTGKRWCDLKVELGAALATFGFKAKITTTNRLIDAVFLGCRPYRVGGSWWWGPTLGRRLYKHHCMVTPDANPVAWLHGVAKMEAGCLGFVPVLGAMARRVLQLSKGCKVTAWKPELHHGIDWRENRDAPKLPDFETYEMLAQVYNTGPHSMTVADLMELEQLIGTAESLPCIISHPALTTMMLVDEL